MKRPGPPCAVCVHPRRSEIDGARGAAQLRKATALGVSRSALDRHRKHASNVVEKTEAMPPPAPTTEREALLDALAKAKQGLAKTETEDLPRVLNAITSISKRLGQLDADREISEEEIVRAPAFRSLLERFREALRPYPDAVGAMLRAIEGA